MYGMDESLGLARVVVRGDSFYRTVLAIEDCSALLG